MLSVEDWAEIRRRHLAEGLGVKTIAKRLGVARNTVRIAVRSGQPLHSERGSRDLHGGSYTPLGTTRFTCPSP